MTLALPSASRAQSWTGPVRGSWVLEGARGTGVVIAAPGSASEIIVAANENSAVQQAAVFLAGDIGRITGHAPAIVHAAAGARTRLHLVTLGNGTVPTAIASDVLRGKAESHQILTDGDDIWLVGADARGTAYAAYTLSERIGIDPLYLWTGFTPQKRTTLILRQTNHLVGPPTIRYRGLFHDDEDILPRPFEDAGYPLRIGDVPLEWYARFFETALRLRMNMVAPYARTHRRAEVQQMASDWGLFYTSHHYDILLSNPFGFERYGLARERGAGTSWDWYTNRRGMLDYWRGGVRENALLHAIWPVGLRGAEDRAYDFPANTSPAEQLRVFREAVDSQLAITRALAPADPSPLFTFTLYSEMLARFESGSLSVPPEVILVWPDDNDGVMRGLPTSLGGRKHGVYYHLAYFGPRTKQVTHIVGPATVAREFTRIRDAGATEYALVNVTELRDFVMETRMIADIAWDANRALSPTDPSTRFVKWWSHEYFGAGAAAAESSYADRQRLLGRFDDIWRGSEQVRVALHELHARFNGAPSHALAADTVAMLSRLDREYRAAMSRGTRASLAMTPEARQFFLEHVMLGLLIDWRPTQAALLLDRALREPDARRAW
ncbi:MAG: glycosyl hydrolase 115 family protein, partial [Gemmatimonadaceae bacterium]|nr:glycosyl hydrolase 115 family protein [Gemmatimonadaceae bacterium]